MGGLEEEGGRWLALSEAAAQLGLTGEALRKRIRRGHARGRRDNHGRWLVLVQDGLEPVRSERLGSVPDGDLERTRTELALALDRLERADGDVADLRAEAASLRNERDGLRAELARERNRAEDMRVEAAELRGRLAEATRPGPLGRLVEALASRLLGIGAGGS